MQPLAYTHTLTQSTRRYKTLALFATGPHISNYYRRLWKSAPSMANTLSGTAQSYRAPSLIVCVCVCVCLRLRQYHKWSGISSLNWSGCFFFVCCHAQCADRTHTQAQAHVIIKRDKRYDHVCWLYRCLLFAAQMYNKLCTYCDAIRAQWWLYIETPIILSLWLIQMPRARADT